MPSLGEIAYFAFAQVQPTPQPLYKALSASEQLGWGAGVHAALLTVLDPGAVPLPSTDAPSLAALMRALRADMQTYITAQALSLKQAARQCGIDRKTLTKWLSGEDSMTVTTLLTCEAWLHAVERG